VVSALVDFGVDWLRFGAEGYFTWLGLGNEIFGAGVLLLSAAILAIAFGQREFVLALPVLVLAGFPLLQLVRIAPSVLLVPNPGTIFFWSVFDVLMIVWAFLLCARCVALSLAPSRPGRWRRALLGGLVLI